MNPEQEEWLSTEPHVRIELKEEQEITFKTPTPMLAVLSDLPSPIV